MSENATKIVLAIIGLFAAGFAVKFFIDKSANKVNQIGNSVKGDQAGRDIKRG